jgi:hypothetical protein
VAETRLYADYLARCRSALSELTADARADAERVLALVSARDRGDLADEPSARRDLLGLIERLGRRASVGVPFASLARALSADLRGSTSVVRESLEACDRALQLRGL